MPVEYPPQQPFYATTCPPLSGPDIDRDVNALRKAMKGMGTDEKAMIEVLCNRTAEQALQLLQGFKSHFGRDLLKDIESETSGNFKKLMISLAMPLAEVDAVALKEAMEGMGTDDDVLIEILAGRTNNEINAIKAAYKTKYNKDLESAVQSETSGEFRKLLTCLLQGARDQNSQWDVNADVDALYKAGVGKMGTDESMFISILVNRPEHHLRAVFDAYKQKHNMTMETVLKKEFSGDIEKALVSIVRAVENRPLYVAKLFEKSMAGLGTKDEKLIRLTVRHREPRIMGAVKAAYQQEYKKTLYKRVEGETSGDYRKALLACIKE